MVSKLEKIPLHVFGMQVHIELLHVQIQLLFQVIPLHCNRRDTVRNPLTFTLKITILKVEKVSSDKG
jgi:hypothetical protein